MQGTYIISFLSLVKWKLREVCIGCILTFLNLLVRRAAIEYEKKGYAENYEHGQMMEKKLVAMSRELEKLRAEIANAEKRARAAAAAASVPAPAVGNPGRLPFYSYKCFWLWISCKWKN